MGTVHYKFTYNSEIDFPESIEFDGTRADIKNDNKNNYTIEGDVKGVALDEEDQLSVFVSSSGRTGRTWQLEVSFNTKKLQTYPIDGTIKNSGICTLNQRHRLQP